MTLACEIASWPPAIPHRPPGQGRGLGKHLVRGQLQLSVLLLLQESCFSVNPRRHGAYYTNTPNLAPASCAPCPFSLVSGFTQCLQLVLGLYAQVSQRRLEKPHVTTLGCRVQPLPALSVMRAQVLGLNPSGEGLGRGGPGAKGWMLSRQDMAMCTTTVSSGQPQGPQSPAEASPLVLKAKEKQRTERSSFS